MKKILEFNFPEDKDEYELHNKGPNYFLALERIAMEIFRPARKHGYGHGAISTFLKEHEQHEDLFTELIGILEQEFYKIKNEEDCNE